MLSMKRMLVIGFFLLGMVSSTVASAGIIWDEAIDGSLSTDRFSTSYTGTLAVGNNNLIGSTVSGINKFFSITIGANDELAAIIVDDWWSLDDLGFLGVVDNSHFSVDPANIDVTALLGYAHYGTLDVGNDILTTMGMGPGSQGFSAPLGSGTYSFWVRQGGPDVAEWDLNFVVTAVPEPSTGLLLALGLIGLTARTRIGSR